MRRICYILISLMLLVFPIQCIEYDFHLDLLKDGSLYERTNMDPAKDFINAQGEQKYDKYYIEETDRKIFISNYSLTNSPDKFGKGIYSISFISPGGSNHFARIESSKGIQSDSRIDMTNKMTTTKFKISGSGDLYEGIGKFDPRMVRLNLLSETRATGTFSMLSNLKSNHTVVSDTDMGRLMDNLDSVKLPSESGKVNVDVQKTDLIINGEKREEITSGAKGTVTVGNQEVEYNLKAGIASESKKSEALDNLMKKNVSIHEEYNGDIISWQQDKVEDATLEIDVESDPKSGPLNSVVNFTITLENFGQTRFDHTQITNKLPQEMELLTKSNDFVYKDGNIYWPAAGPLGPLQSKNVTFQARIKELIPDSIEKLNDSVEAQGLRSDGTSDSESTWTLFTIQRPPMIVEMYSDRDEISNGDKVTYTINIKNTGKEDLRNVLLRGSLPRGLDFVDSTSNVILSNGLITWKGDSLSSGKTKTLTYVAEVAGDHINGEILDNSVEVTAQSNLDEDVKAENSTKIKFVKGQDISSNETRYIVMSVSGSEIPVGTPKINLTLKTDYGSNTAVKLDEVKYTIILDPENTTFNNVYLEVELDPDLGFKSSEDSIKFNNGRLSWSRIDSISEKLEKSFVAEVKNTNAGKTSLNVSASVKSEEPISEENESIGLKIESGKNGNEAKSSSAYSEETDLSVIMRQLDEGAPPRKTLMRPFHQLGQRLIWDRHAYNGWKVPRPQEIEYFIVNETDEKANGTIPALIGSLCEKKYSIVNETDKKVNGTIPALNGSFLEKK